MEKVSTINDWKKKINAKRPLLLPSGITIVIRPLNLLEQAFCGHIDLKLVNYAMKTSSKMNSEKWENLSESDLDHLMKVLRKTAVLAVVEPKVSEEKTEDAMFVEDIPMNDLLAIFGGVMSGEETTGMDSFRRK